MLTSRKPTVATVRAGARASARKARWSAVAAPRVQRSPSRIAGASSRPAATAATKQTSAGSRMYRSRFPLSVPALALPLLSPIAIATAAPIAATSTSRGPRPRRRPSRSADGHDDREGRDHPHSDHDREPEQRDERVPEHGAGRQPGCVRDREHGDHPHDEAQEHAGERQGADLGRDREPDLRAPRSALRQAAGFVPDPAPHADRGDERESEQERADLAADEHHALRRDVSLAPRVEQRCVGRRELEGVALAREQGLHRGLAGEHAGDLPDLQPGRIDRRDPGVRPEDAVESRQVLELGGAASEQEHRAPQLRDGRGGAQRAAEDVSARNLGKPDPDEVNAALVEPGAAAGADLHDLAAARPANARPAAGDEMGDSRQVVDPGEPDELPVHRQRAERGEAVRAGRGEAGERGAHLPVRGRIAPADGQPEGVDAKAPLGGRQRGESPLQRPILSDEAAADDAGKRRGGRCDAGDHEQRPPRPGAQPCGRDRQGSAEPGAAPPRGSPRVLRHR